MDECDIDIMDTPCVRGLRVERRVIHIMDECDIDDEVGIASDVGAREGESPPLYTPPAPPSIKQFTITQRFDLFAKLKTSSIF